jgi:hypothetical protein
VVSFTPRPLYPQGKSPWYTLDRRLGGLHSRSGVGGEEKNSQLMLELEPQIIQPVGQRYVTELSYTFECDIFECETKHNYIRIIIHYEN